MAADSTDTPEFKFPPVLPGDLILVASGPTDPNFAPAFISKVGNAKVNALALRDGGLRPFFALRHVDDPKIQERPDLLQEPDSGVFKLSHREIERQLLVQKVAALDEYVAKLSRLIPPLTQPSGPKGPEPVKKRGRPAKPKPSGD